MKGYIAITVLVLLAALGCGQQQQQLKVTYLSDPAGGTLYRQNGDLWGPCPKALWYDVDEEAVAAGQLEVKGLIVRWPTGPEARSDEMITFPIDGTDQEFTFVQSDESPSQETATQPKADPLPDSPADVNEQGGQTKIEKKVVDLGNGVRIEFAYIPGGEFLMGSDLSAKKVDPNENSTQRVIISKPFYMSVYEVTQEQYGKVMGSNPSRFRGSNRPVETVSWKDAQRFCTELSSAGGVMCRLPTEAEWEYACRAGTTTAYYWGDDFDSRYAWTLVDRKGETHDVGGKEPNDWGLYDMSGNVWEWCSDWYMDPQEPETERFRILRGGSWAGSRLNGRSGHRNWHTPNHRYDDCGFRVVMEVEQAPDAPPSP